MEPVQGRGIKEVVLATLLSIAAYHLSLFGIFFLIPVQVIWSRSGPRQAVTVAVLFGLGIIAVKAIVKVLARQLWTGIDILELALPLILVVGLLGILMLEVLQKRYLYRLLWIAGGIGCLSFPILAWLNQNQGLIETLKLGFAQQWKLVFESAHLEGVALKDLGNPNDFFLLLKETFLGSFLLMVVGFLVFTEWVSSFFLPVDQAKRYQARNFVLPVQGVWILLISWVLLLGKGLLGRLSVTWDWGFLQYVVTNVAGIAIFLYALSGWGIVVVLMERWRWPRIAQIAVQTILLLQVLTPGVGQVLILVGLPMLAVLELWINLRNRDERG